MINVELEWDGVICVERFFVDIDELFFVAPLSLRDGRERIDVSVSQVTEMVLSVAELERCGRDFVVEVEVEDEVEEVANLARATCSGTTCVIVLSWGRDYFKRFLLPMMWPRDQT